jgi:hypothetical protein
MKDDESNAQRANISKTSLTFDVFSAVPLEFVVLQRLV